MKYSFTGHGSLSMARLSHELLRYGAISLLGLMMSFDISAHESCQEPVFPQDDTHCFVVLDESGTAKRLIQVTDSAPDKLIMRGKDNRYVFVQGADGGVCNDCNDSGVNDGTHKSAQSLMERLSTWLGWVSGLGGGASKCDGETFTFATYTVVVSPELFYKKDSVTGEYEEPHEGQKRIVMFAVHGTWTSAQSMGTNEKKITTRYLYDLAKILSHVHGVTVEIVACEWTGTLSQSARFHAGHNLTHVIKNVIASHGVDAIHSLWSIAHSHGCNVVNYAVRQLQKEGYPHTIDVAFHTGSPEPDRHALPGKNEPYNYNNLYHFYSSMDFTQAMGSGLQYGSFSRKIPFGRTKKGYVYNIRLQDEGQYLNHTTIKASALFNAPGLLHAIQTYYKDYYDLDANVFTDTQNPKARMYPLVSIRRPEFKHDSLEQDKREDERVIAVSNDNALTFERLYGRKFNQKPGLWDRLCMYKRECDAKAQARHACPAI